MPNVERPRAEMCDERSVLGRMGTGNWRSVDLADWPGMFSAMSLGEILLHVDKLSPEERTELRRYLDERIIRDRERKLALASEAMARMDAGGGVPLEKVWAVMEEKDRAGG